MVTTKERSLVTALARSILAIAAIPAPPRIAITGLMTTLMVSLTVMTGLVGLCTSVCCLTATMGLVRLAKPLHLVQRIAAPVAVRWRG